MKKKKRKKEKGFKKTIVRQEREREIEKRGADESVRARGRECAHVCT